MRKIIKASVNEEEEAEFNFLKKRLAESDNSKAIKKSINISHWALDLIKEYVPQAVLEAYFNKLNYEKSLSIPSFKHWKENRMDKKHEI